MYLAKRIRARKRPALSGLSSRPYGPGVSRAALGVVNGPPLQGPPDWYKAMHGAALGDDTATTGAQVITDGTAQWQQSMLSATQGVLAAQQDFTKRETFARYMQIAATLSIPLAAAVWRMIFRGGREVD